jgi:hypothetical protein
MLRSHSLISENLTLPMIPLTRLWIALPIPLLVSDLGHMPPFLRTRVDTALLAKSNEKAVCHAALSISP